MRISLFMFHRPAVAAHQNEAVRMFLFVTGAIAFCEQAPGGSKLLPATAGFGFAGAAAVRVVHRITRDTAVDAAYAAMTRPARFAEHDILVLGVADLANRGVTILVDAANLPRRQANGSVP